MDLLGLADHSTQPVFIRKLVPLGGSNYQIQKNTGCQMLNKGNVALHLRDTLTILYPGPTANRQDFRRHVEPVES